MLLKPVVPVFQYALNYEYISEVLCINKEKPEMHCNGKCHLMKELAKASENEKPISDKKSQHSEIEILFIEELQSFDFSLTFDLDSHKNNSVYSNLYYHINSHQIFHPPSFF